MPLAVKVDLMYNNPHYIEPLFFAHPFSGFVSIGRIAPHTSKPQRDYRKSNAIFDFSFPPGLVIAKTGQA
jgi:hypothetical protein